MNKQHSESTKVLTRLLSDTIPEEDAFGHKKISNAIFGLIKDEKKGGKAIALSGGFGSGKSTVIDFLKRKFHEGDKSSEEETGVFIFDAWEHQGNPLRRAFLEKYIDFLINTVKWSTSSEWQNELDEISKNREEIKTTTEPKITTFGGWFAFTLLLLPLGLASVRFGLMPDEHIWLAYAGFGLLLLPAVLLFLIYICWRPILSRHWPILIEEFNLHDKKGYKFIGYFFYHHRPGYHKDSIFNFVFKKTIDEIETTSLKSPEPTTIEFQNLFDRITKQVLKNKKRRLIIVIDNIDRLTTDASVHAWTTLRAFFDHENKNWLWKDQFWLIAPFDFQELSKLWSGLNHFGKSEKFDEDIKPNDYVQAFIDKTFQITFRVQRPVLSDWKKYFKNFLEMAFPNENEEMFNAVTTLYQLKGIKNENSPTPRDIKQFINRVNAQYRVWHNEINLSTLAYYELIADAEPHEFVKKLKSGELVDSTTKSVVAESELNRKLAAIHFNCEVHKAYQVLFGDQVASALQEGEAEDLEKFYETDGFKDVLQSEFHALLGRGIPLSLANCALCLKKIEKGSEHDFINYFHHLSTALNEVTFKIFERKIGEGIITIWDRIGFDENWMIVILNKLSSVDFDEENTIEKWISLIHPVIKRLREKNILYLLKSNFKIPGGVNEYIKVLSFINNLENNYKNEIAKYIEPNAEPGQVVAAYTKSISSEELPSDLGSTLHLLSLGVGETNVNEWNWDSLLSQIKGIIQPNTNSRVDQIEAALKMILVFSTKLKIKKAIELSNDKNFRHGLFYILNNQSDENLTALLVLSSILFNPNNDHSVSDNNVNNGISKLNNILSKPDDKIFMKNDFVDYLIDLNLLDNFLELQHQSDNFKTLSMLVIKELFKKDETKCLLNADIILKYFDEIQQSIAEDPFLSHIMSLYKNEEGLVDRILMEYDTVPSHYLLHYYFVQACPEELRESYIAFLSEGLQNIEEDVWVDNLTSETELVYLVIFIQQSGIDLKLPVRFKNALDDHFKKLYAGSIDPPSDVLVSNWNLLLETLDESVRTTFLNSIKYHIENNEVGLVSKVGYLYDSILIEEGVFLNESGRFISTVIMRVLKSDDSKELQWLRNLLFKQQEILHNNNHAKNALYREIESLKLESYSPEAQSEIQEIAKNLGVHIKSVEKDENGEKGK